MKQEITITERVDTWLGTTAQRMIEADVSGGLAVHKEGRIWVLSHVRSGWALGESRTKRDAIYCRDWLAGVYDWEAVDEHGFWPSSQSRAFCLQHWTALKDEGRIGYLA